MKSQEMNDVQTLVKANIKGTINDPENFIIYGTDMLSAEQIEMFDKLFNMESVRLFNK